MSRFERGLSLCLRSLLVLAFLAGCSQDDGTREKTALQRLVRPMMGTLVEVLWQPEGRPDDVSAARAAMDRMADLASRMNARDADSEVSRIVDAAGTAPAQVSGEVLEVIEKALEISRITGGAFDVTVGALEAVWGNIQWEGGGRLPAPEEIQDALSRVGYRFVRTNRERKTVYLEQKGVRLDLGGIAKGYIVDQGIRCLKEAGIRHALIHAGGDLRTLGDRQGSPWRIGLQDPGDPQRLLGVFRVKDAAVVTSGNYERYFESPKGRFGHILDPHAGRPVEGLLSVSVVAEDAAYADALATAFMVKGKEGTLALVSGLPSVQIVLIEVGGAIWVSRGLEKVLEWGGLPAGYTVEFLPGPPSSS